ncbi:MAG: hypothetical protein J6X53_10260 [Abditibacteriota bacterium]|nr:hypothetical protein [Abditibacteriota bacterium]
MGITITTGLIVAVLSGAAGVIGAFTTVVKPIRGLIDDIRAIKSGLKSVHRFNMLEMYYQHVEARKIKQYERENFDAEYKAYKALGGNSFIDSLYEEVKKWEVVP